MVLDEKKSQQIHLLIPLKSQLRANDVLPHVPIFENNNNYYYFEKSKTFNSNA